MRDGYWSTRVGEEGGWWAGMWLGGAGLPVRVAGRVAGRDVCACMDVCMCSPYVGNGGWKGVIDGLGCVLGCGHGQILG